MPKKKGFYATEPAVPDKKIAGENPIGTVELGMLKSPTVPEHEGVIHGLGPQTKQFHYPHVRGAHGYGHPPKARVGHLRYSSNPKAHRIGGK